MNGHDQRPPNGPRQDEVSRAELLTEGTNGLLFANGGGAAVLLALLEFMPELRGPVVAAGACLVAGVVFALFVTLARFDLSKKYWASTDRMGDEKTDRTAEEKAEIARLAVRWRRFYISSIVAFSLGVSIVLFAACCCRAAHDARSDRGPTSGQARFLGRLPVIGSSMSLNWTMWASATGQLRSGRIHAGTTFHAASSILNV